MRRGWLFVDSPSWRRSVSTLRILCPLGFLLALVMGLLSWRLGFLVLAFTNGFLAGINLCLSYVNWFVFRVNP